MIAGVTVRQASAVGHHPMSNIKSLHGGFVRHWMLAAACPGEVGHFARVRQRIEDPLDNQDPTAATVIRGVSFRLRTPHNAALWWLPHSGIGSLT